MLTLSAERPRLSSQLPCHLSSHTPFTYGRCCECADRLVEPSPVHPPAAIEYPCESSRHTSIRECCGDELTLSGDQVHEVLVPALRLHRDARDPLAVEHRLVACRQDGENVRCRK